MGCEHNFNTVFEQIISNFPKSPQPDWNAAEGEDGHILNRFAYKEYISTEIIQETTMTLESTNDLSELLQSSVEIGDPVTVVWNGEEYSDVAKEFFDASWFGNLYLLNNQGWSLSEEVNTGEPFLLSFGENTCTLLVADGVTEATFKLSAVKTVYHPIPYEYMPMMVIPFELVNVDKTYTVEEQKTYFKDAIHALKYDIPVYGYVNGEKLKITKISMDSIDFMVWVTCEKDDYNLMVYYGGGTVTMEAKTEIHLRAFNGTDIFKITVDYTGVISATKVTE